MEVKCAAFVQNVKYTICMHVTLTMDSHVQ